MATKSLDEGESCGDVPPEELMKLQVFIGFGVSLVGTQFCLTAERKVPIVKGMHQVQDRTVCDDI